MVPYGKGRQSGGRFGWSRSRTRSPSRVERLARYGDYSTSSYTRDHRPYPGNRTRPYYPQLLTRAYVRSDWQTVNTEPYTIAESRAITPVVNDAVLQERIDRNYYLSSSEEGDDDDAPSPSSLPNADTGPRTANFPRVRTRTPLPEYLQDHTEESHAAEDCPDQPIDMKALEKLESSGTPFLMWGVTGGATSHQEKKSSLTSLHRLLRKIDKSLRPNTIYSSGYRCSLQELLKRHKILNRQRSRQAQNHGLSKDESHEKTVDASSVNSLHDQLPLGGGPEALKPADDTPMDIMDTVESLISEIFILSRSIMGLFIPFGAMSLGDVELVIDHYWGALDLLFRVSL